MEGERELGKTPLSEHLGVLFVPGSEGRLDPWAAVMSCLGCQSHVMAVVAWAS